MRGFAYLKNVATLELNVEVCNGCGDCIRVCPHQVFALANKKAAIVDKDACMECGACSINCAQQAIQVDAGVGCASGMINEWMATIRPGKQKHTCC